MAGSSRADVLLACSENTGVYSNTRNNASSRNRDGVLSSHARKNLAAVRVLQRNLVYIIGLPPIFDSEEIIAANDAFGSFGEIVKVALPKISSSHNDRHPHYAFSSCVYITYASNEGAARCIKAVHGNRVGGRTLRASFGTTKYCHCFLRGTECTNPECLFLHALGDEKDSFTREQMAAGMHLDPASTLPSDIQLPTHAMSTQSLPETVSCLPGWSIDGVRYSDNTAANSNSNTLNTFTNSHANPNPNSNSTANAPARSDHPSVVLPFPWKEKDAPAPAPANGNEVYHGRGGGSSKKERGPSKEKRGLVVETASGEVMTANCAKIVAAYEDVLISTHPPKRVEKVAPSQGFIAEENYHDNSNPTAHVNGNSSSNTKGGETSNSNTNTEKRDGRKGHRRQNFLGHNNHARRRTHLRVEKS